MVNTDWLTIVIIAAFAAGMYNNFKVKVTKFIMTMHKKRSRGIKQY